MGNFSFWDGAARYSHSRVGVQGFPGLILLTGCNYKYISSHPARHIFYGTAMYRSHIKIKKQVYSNTVGQTVLLWLLIVLWWLNFQRSSSNYLSLFSCGCEEIPWQRQLQGEQVCSGSRFKGAVHCGEVTAGDGGITRHPKNQRQWILVSN